MDKRVMEQALSNYATPFYLFETDACIDKIREMKAVFGQRVAVCFAMKANPFLVSALCQEADYIEVCSPGEFRICERAGIPMEKVVLSGVYKSKDDIEAILEKYGEMGTYTVESPSQWDMLDHYTRTHGAPVRVLLRLTSGNQFGLEPEEIFHILRLAGSCQLVEVEGIQFFSGTQKKPARMGEELQKLDEFLRELRDSYGFVPQKLEYGPGFPVDYFGDDPLIESTMISSLSEKLSLMHFQGRVILEVGRAIAASCGSFVTEVVDVKTRKNKHYCIVDGGIHQLNYYGQMVGMKTPPVTHWEEGQEQPLPWTVFGSLCTTNDVLIREHPLSGLRVGSHLAFGKAGAYSVTESLSLFLSRDLPQVVLYSAEKGFDLARAPMQTDCLNSPMMK